MKLLNELRDTRSYDWTEAAKWILYVMLGGTMPVWGGILLFLLFSKPVDASYFLDHGEFALYSAAILSPTLYIILKDTTTSNFVYRHLFAGICVVALLVSVLLFGAVTSAYTGTIVIDKLFLRSLTTILYTFSLVLAFLITVLDNTRSYKDFMRERSEQLSSLENQFDAEREE